MEGQRNRHGIGRTGGPCADPGAARAGSGIGRGVRLRPWMAAAWLALAGPALAIEVVHAEFGVFVPRQAAASGAAGNADDLTLEPTRLVPHTVGTRYGWAIELRTDKRRVSVREEYLLPATFRNEADNGRGSGHGDARGDGHRPPAQSAPLPAGADTRTLAFERRNTVSQRQLAPRNGLIFGEWEIGPGEPPGRRHLQVIVEGEIAADFEYEVRAAP